MGYKFNNGRGAIICDVCSRILAEDVRPWKVQDEELALCTMCGAGKITVDMTREEGVLLAACLGAAGYGLAASTLRERVCDREDPT